MRTSLTVIEMVELRKWLATGRAMEIRRDAGLSRSVLARSIGTDESTVFRWESGERRPAGLYAAAYYQALARLAKVAAHRPAALLESASSSAPGGSGALAS